MYASGQFGVTCRQEEAGGVRLRKFKWLFLRFQISTALFSGTAGRIGALFAGCDCLSITSTSVILCAVFY